MVTHEDGSIDFNGIEDDNVWEEVKQAMRDIIIENEKKAQEEGNAE